MHMVKPLQVPVDVDPADYEQFTGGTAPVRRVFADWQGDLVLVEHERGHLHAFDEHLRAVRRHIAEVEVVDHELTWSAITGADSWPGVVRLELSIDRLRCRPRLLFCGHTLRLLWLLADGASLGLLLDPIKQPGDLARARAWIFGPEPIADGLAQVLHELGVPRPASPGRRRAWQRRFRRSPPARPTPRRTTRRRAGRDQARQQTSNHQHE